MIIVEIEIKNLVEQELFYVFFLSENIQKGGGGGFKPTPYSWQLSWRQKLNHEVEYQLIIWVWWDQLIGRVLHCVFCLAWCSGLYKHDFVRENLNLWIRALKSLMRSNVNMLQIFVWWKPTSHRRCVDNIFLFTC